MKILEQIKMIKNIIKNGYIVFKSILFKRNVKSILKKPTKYAKIK